MKRALMVLLAACAVPREPAGREDSQCAWCHGDATRTGTALEKAAPPRDLRGNSGVEFPTVGAHLRHLQGSDVFPKVRCQSCHPVPQSLESTGHNDGTTQLLVTWDVASRTCAGTCHGPVSGVWTRPREETCGTCHGVPPALPHPPAPAATCAACHGSLSPRTHVDGQVTLLSPVSCNACHEPEKTGAHQTHLTGGRASKPLECGACHVVPSTVATPVHPNGHVEVDAGFDAASVSCATSCHFGRSPVWTEPGPLSCTGCHASPPAYPHPQLASCSTCHPSDRASHVNGTVEVAVPASCDGCHGSAANPAPPRDVDGGADPSRPGVGAHQAHVVGRGTARVVQCGECHRVPAAVRENGHLDGVTQVRFTGVALANLTMPSYSGGSCSNTACHDVSNWTGGAPGGGTATVPKWTSVDAGQATCTSCHGRPPPAPHPFRADCASCHDTAPARHVDGRVDFVP